MTELSAAEMWLQMQDSFKQMIESATGVKAMAEEAGFLPDDASRMGAESFNFLLQSALNANKS